MSVIYQNSMVVLLTFEYHPHVSSDGIGCKDEGCHAGSLFSHRENSTVVLSCVGRSLITCTVLQDFMYFEESPNQDNRHH